MALKNSKIAKKINPKNSHDHIWLLKKVEWKKYLGETPIDTVIDYFYDWNNHQLRLSLYTEIWRVSLSFLSQKKKKLKIREMKCGIKIEFLTTKGIYDLLITKKDEGLK